MKKNKPNTFLSAEDAKTQVFSHWKYLDGLAQRRFPKDENLGHEALLFILQQLEADQWQRIRNWQGQGPFISFLTVIASRLLTDFSRKQYGHVRKPLWLSEKRDLFWDQAYHLLKVQNNNRQESIETLCCSQPQRTRENIEKMVTTILQKCSDTATHNTEESLSLEVCVEQGTLKTAPDELLDIKEVDLMEILLQFLNENNTYSLPEHLIKPLHGIKSILKFSEEDHLLLRLRYLDGFNMKSIVEAVNFKGDPYKRYHKLINKLRQSFQEVGLINSDTIAF